MANSTASTDRGAGFRFVRRLAAAVLALALLPAGAARAEIVIGIAAAISGAAAWEGEQHLRGVQAAVTDINEAGGVLGQSLRLLIGDDGCDDVQAVAVANQLVADGAVFVSGHLCSHASIAASAEYDRADVVMISPSSTNPLLTEQGRPNVFRVCGRDDGQGRVAAAYLAETWPDGRIGLVHDRTLFGEGLTAETRRHLVQRGIAETLYRGLPQERVDYGEFAGELAAAGLDVLYIAGYIREVALLVRELGALEMPPPVVGAELVGDEFWLIAGEAANGVRFTFSPDRRDEPHAAEVVRRLREQGFEPAGFTLPAYATVQVWAQAAAAAGTTDPDSVMRALRAGTFDTVLGTIGFDEKGDVTGIEVHSWYVWRDGQYYPVR
jgi:branched-chain amino acid transport system substrate-binding protein